MNKMNNMYSSNILYNIDNSHSSTNYNYLQSIPELLQNFSIEALFLLLVVPIIIYFVEYINYFNILRNLSIIKNSFPNSSPVK
jgi:hypothetical protein